MKKLIIANWKMNPEKESEALKLAKAEDFKNAVVAPPFVFLEEVGRILKKAELGAQDIFVAPKNKRAFTGEISPKMLKNLNVKYVILGHSERRKNFKETDAIINKKALAALKIGLKAILCVGENAAVRKKGIAASKKFVKTQLQKDLKFSTHHSLPTTNLIIAYEPVWAISSSKNAKSDSPEDAVEMIQFIKKSLVISYKSSVKVLYGGSVNSKTIGGFLKYKEIDGFLVGGASLDQKEFQKISRVINTT